MAAGDAAALSARLGRRVCIVDRHHRPRSHILWRDNPAIAVKFDRSCAVMRNVWGARPYINYAKSTADRWAFLDYRPNPAQLYFTPGELAAAEAAAIDGAIILNPALKTNAPPGKRWPDEKWRLLAGILGETRPLVQLGAGIFSPRLPGVRQVRTRNFREACAVLARARGLITHEGGLHHAAAAVGVPAVVIYGGYISPTVTGYDSQTNLFSGDDRTLGWRHKNELCRLAMEMITVHEVVENAAEAFQDTAQRHIA